MTRWTRLTAWFRQRHCSHVFYFEDMITRDHNGKVHWACAKCAKAFELDYGLQAPGKIGWRGKL